MGKVKYTTARINELLDKVANRLSGSDTDDIDALISGIRDELADKADSESTTEAISGITRSIGAANGIAPLGGDSRVPAGYVDLKAVNIQEFSGFVEDAEITLGSAMGTPAIVFNRATSTFVAEVRSSGGGLIGGTPTYHQNWQGREDTDAGTPRENTVYIDVTTDIPYRWNGEVLVPIAMPLGEEEGTAFPGEKGAQLKTDLDDIALEVGNKEPLLANSEDIEHAQIKVNTPQGIKTVLGLSLTDSAKQRLFCDLFNAAADPFGSRGPIGYARITDGAFDCELNGLPLTYEEAVLIYNVTNGAPAVGQCAGTAIRTNLWTVRPTYGSGASIDLLPPGIFVNCGEAEVLRIHKGSDNIAWAGDWRNMFTGCGSLREIIGIIGDYAAHGSISPFQRCAKLEKVKIHRLNGDIVLADSPLIDLESFTYIVTNRGAGTNTITITVHPDVYAKLTAHLRPEEEGYEDRDTDWDDLLDLAATHKITFASA